MDSTPSSPSLVSILSLLACAAQVFAAAMLTRRYGGQSSKEDRWILLWLFYDAIVHLTLVHLTIICLHVSLLFVYFGPLFLLVMSVVYCSCIICFFLSLCLEGPFVWLCMVCLVFCCPSRRKVLLFTCLWLGQWRRLKVRWLNSVSLTFRNLTEAFYQGRDTCTFVLSVHLSPVYREGIWNSR